MCVCVTRDTALVKCYKCYIGACIQHLNFTSLVECFCVYPVESKESELRVPTR
jgi:hypothetical protein